MLQNDDPDIAEAISAGGKMDIFSDNCVINCTDNGRNITAVVDRFEQGRSISVIINKEIRMTMIYNGHEYVANKQGLEFTTKGPSVVRSVNDGRR